MKDLAGDRDALSVVRVPTVEEEDRRRLLRERDAVVQQSTGCSSGGPGWMCYRKCARLPKWHRTGCMNRKIRPKGSLGLTEIPIFRTISADFCILILSPDLGTGITYSLLFRRNQQRQSGTGARIIT